jgi:hypothetical protein
VSWQDVHEHIAEQGASQLPKLDGALLTRSVVVTEWALPNGEKKLMHITMTDGSSQLKPWETAGLLISIVSQILSRS